MKTTSTLTMDFGEDEIASRIYLALLPEVKTNKSKTAQISIRQHGSRVVLLIDSSTIASLRALLNSYIRWVSTSLEVMKLKGD